MEKLSTGGAFFMECKQSWRIIVSGGCAGAVNGLLGAGGGMVLVPLLTAISKIEDEKVFPASVSIILPISIVSLLGSRGLTEINFHSVLPYLIGSTAGGLLCGFLGKKIPTKWLHRFLGIVILWGGIRYLC